MSNWATKYSETLSNTSIKFVDRTSDPNSTHGSFGHRSLSTTNSLIHRDWRERWEWFRKKEKRKRIERIEGRNINKVRCFEEKLTYTQFGGDRAYSWWSSYYPCPTHISSDHMMRRRACHSCQSLSDNLLFWKYFAPIRRNNEAVHTPARCVDCVSAQERIQIPNSNVVVWSADWQNNKSKETKAKPSKKFHL